MKNFEQHDLGSKEKSDVHADVPWTKLAIKTREGLIRKGASGLGVPLQTKLQSGAQAYTTVQNCWFSFADVLPTFGESAVEKGFGFV